VGFGAGHGPKKNDFFCGWEADILLVYSSVKEWELVMMKISNANIKSESDYEFIVQKIWNNEFEDLENVILDRDFLYEMAVQNTLWQQGEGKYFYIGDEEAVVWYLKKFHPDVFCEDFMEIFFDVEEEEPDYDYRDWKTSKKWLIFARYIMSCGGLDEWKWYNVFSDVMLDYEEKKCFSCDKWLSKELKRKEFGDWNSIKL
jgi:hypothetical protein